MSEVVYKTVLQSLMSSISSTQKLIEQAIDPKNFINARKTTQSLQNTIDELETFLRLGKPTKKFGRQKKPTTYLINAIRSNLHAIENREITLAEFCKDLRTDVFDRLQDLREAARTHLEKIVEDPELMLEEGLDDPDLELESVTDKEEKLSEDTSDFSQAQYEYVNGKLKTYTELINSSLVSKIKNDKLNISRTAVLPVEIPITVSFENAALRNTKLLRHIFRHVEPLGLAGSDSSDVALILTNQVILQFGRTASEEVAHDIVNNDSVAKNLATNKDRLKSERSNLRKLNAHLENLQNQQKSHKRLGTLTKERRESYVKELAETKQRIEQQEQLVQKFIGRSKEAKSLHRSRLAAMERKTANVYYTRICDFLEKLRERGQEYSLMSFDFVTSPKNTDIALAWIVPTSVYKNLYSQTKGNVKVLSWGLPLSSKIGGGKNAKDRKPFTRGNKT